MGQHMPGTVATPVGTQTSAFLKFLVCVLDFDMTRLANATAPATTLLRENKRRQYREEGMNH